MSAETLRRAAALMRERAVRARAGRWYAESATVSAKWNHGPQPVAVGSGSLPEGNMANAEHIASWHPVAALAVADWLEAAANGEAYWQAYGDTDARLVAEPEALAVARAYLGEDS